MVPKQKKFPLPLNHGEVASVQTFMFGSVVLCFNDAVDEKYHGSISYRKMNILKNDGRNDPPLPLY